MANTLAMTTAGDARQPGSVLKGPTPQAVGGVGKERMSAKADANTCVGVKPQDKKPLSSGQEWEQSAGRKNMRNVFATAACLPNEHCM